MDEQASVTVFRFDPTTDKESRYVTYKVPPEGWKNLMVLDTIRYIFENLDGGLSFRESCRFKTVCSACVVMVNKKLVMACDTPSKQEMLLEPAPNFPLIKDLVVRFEGKRGE